MEVQNTPLIFSLKNILTFYNQIKSVMNYNNGIYTE